MSPELASTLAAVNALAKSILVDTSVESYGVLNQNLFIDFRNASGEDSRLIINGLLDLSTFNRFDGMSNIEYALLCMNKVNLLTINNVMCNEYQELIIQFDKNLVFKVSPNKEMLDEDIWQLNSSLHVSEGGKSIIALVGGGYAVW